MTIGTLTVSSPAEATWSTYAKQYAAQRGHTLVQPMLVACMEQCCFPVLDKLAVKATVAQPLRILILAGGPGPEVPLLVKRYGREALRILLTDLSPTMVEEARTHVAADNLQYIVETRTMDATNIEVAAASFDVVLMCYGIFSVVEYEKCFVEVARALKPDGVFFLSTPGMDNATFKLLDEEKLAWLQMRYGDDMTRDANAIESQRRLSTVRDMPWRRIEVLRQRLQACATFNNGVNVAVASTMWCSADEHEIKEVYDAFYHHPQNNNLFLYDFPTERQRRAFFERVRQQAYVVAKADGGLRADSNCAWARKGLSS